MISFANLHDDIGNDLFDHKEQLNRLDEFHYPRFKEGTMKFSAIVSFALAALNHGKICKNVSYMPMIVFIQVNISHLTTIKIFKSLSC